MTSQRRKAMKWRKWKAKNPDKATDAYLRKLAKIEMFDKKMKRLILRAFDHACTTDNPLEKFFVSHVIEPMPMGCEVRLFDTEDEAKKAYREALNNE